jgi:hypothetical protein
MLKRAHPAWLGRRQAIYSTLTVITMNWTTILANANIPDGFLRLLATTFSP